MLYCFLVTLAANQDNSCYLIGKHAVKRSLILQDWKFRDKMLSYRSGLICFAVHIRFRARTI